MPKIENATKTSSSAGIGAVVCPLGNLPLAALEYRSKIAGLAIETRVTQTFTNPHDHVIEATYIFPLPENGAVTSCRMKIGSRVIEAVLRERQEARKEYQQAIQAGHRAALLEEDRSETFSLQVGNLAPDDIVEVSLTLVSPLHVAGGEATLRLPLVVAPKYVPGQPLDGKSVGKGTNVDTDQVPDASRISPPVLLEGFPNAVRLAIQVKVDPVLIAGTSRETDCESNNAVPSWFDKLSSPLFPISIVDGEVHTIQLDPLQRANSDFLLRFPVVDQEVRTIARAERCSGGSDSGKSEANDTVSGTDESSVLAATIVPPAKSESTLQKNARDILFVLDRSGSMGGWKVDAAVRATVRLIESLGPDDRFQVIAFDDVIERPEGLPQTWIAATDENRWQAVRWLATIGARGGTEMGTALISALRQFKPTESGDMNADKSRSRSIVLVTDGQVAAENSILASIARFNSQTRPRLFAIGVDRCVNMGILKKLADATGGTTELVESRERLEQVFARLADEIGNPWVTELAFELQTAHGVLDIRPEIFPQSVSTLFHGRPATFYARIPKSTQLSADSGIRVSGRLANGKQWQSDIALETAESGPGVAMWGRHAVRSLEDQYVMTGSSSAALQKKIIGVSLLANVLCRFTAYIAVDKDQKVVGHEQSEMIVQPVETPAGWAHKAMASGRKAKRSVSLGCLSASPPMRRRQDEDLHEEATELIPESVARGNMVMPAGVRDGKLEIHMEDPNDTETIEKLRFILNKEIVVTPASRDEIVDQINQSYGQDDGESADSILQEFTDTAIDFTETDDSDGIAFDSDASPVAKFVLAMLEEAIKLRASHVLAIPTGSGVQIYYLIAGELMHRDTIAESFSSAVVNRLKVLCKIELGVKHEPQSGTMAITVKENSGTNCVFMMPTVHGTAVLIRCQHQANSLDQSIRPEQLAKLISTVSVFSQTNRSKASMNAIADFQCMLKQ